MTSLNLFSNKQSYNSITFYVRECNIFAHFSIFGSTTHTLTFDETKLRQFDDKDNDAPNVHWL